MKSDQCRFSFWHPVRRIVFVIATLVTFITLFYVIENWRGRHAWEKYKAELTTQGERLSLSDYAVKPVPAEQNFAETPILRAIAYKSTMDTNAWEKFRSVRGIQTFSPMGPDVVRKENAEEILNAFQPIEPEIAELRAAAKRPYAQFTNNQANAFLADLPNFVAMRTITQFLILHSYAELAGGHSDRAFADIEVVHRLADALNVPSTLVTAMMRVAILGATLGPFEQGLSTGAWSEQELAAFQKYFESVDLLTGFDAALRGGERNGITKLVEDLPRQQLTETMAGRDVQNMQEYLFKLAVRWCPRGWLYQNAINYSRMMQKSVEVYDVRAQRVFPEKCDAALAYILKELQVASPFKYLAGRAVPNLARATQAMAQQQAHLHEAALACALERYRRAHGEYPENLAALVPQSMNKLPNDLMTGEALKYQRAEKDKFRLYSVGWNLKDDGGTRNTNRMAGDWVWPPAKQQ
ncbi:MAG TPA: hypothetical protein VGF13_04385 [Verrucomicrobiae bacterium]|jgi:hypothetical protein